MNTVFFLLIDLVRSKPGFAHNRLVLSGVRPELYWYMGWCHVLYWSTGVLFLPTRVSDYLAGPIYLVPPAAQEKGQ